MYKITPLHLDRKGPQQYKNLIELRIHWKLRLGYLNWLSMGCYWMQWWVTRKWSATLHPEFGLFASQLSLTFITCLNYFLTYIGKNTTPMSSNNIKDLAPIQEKDETASANKDGKNCANGETENLSKRQRKRLMKHQQWEEQRDLRK